MLEEILTLKSNSENKVIVDQKKPPNTKNHQTRARTQIYTACHGTIVNINLHLLHVHGCMENSHSQMHKTRRYNLIDTPHYPKCGQYAEEHRTKSCELNLNRQSAAPGSSPQHTETNPVSTLSSFTLPLSSKEFVEESCVVTLTVTWWLCHSLLQNQLSQGIPRNFWASEMVRSKERLKNKVMELIKTKWEVIKFCILSLSCFKKEKQKDRQDYKPKQTNKNKQQPQKTPHRSHDWGNLVDQKNELPGHSWHGERAALEEEVAGESPGECQWGTLCNMELQSSKMDCLSYLKGQKQRSQNIPQLYWW